MTSRVRVLYTAFFAHFCPFFGLFYRGTVLMCDFLKNEASTAKMPGGIKDALGSYASIAVLRFEIHASNQELQPPVFA
jgi:hypothetical protein